MPRALTLPALPTLPRALAALLWLAAAAAQAHGDGHAAARVYDPAKVEATSFGREGDPAQVRRTVVVDMADTMRFTPALLQVRQGETVRLRIRNRGRLLHELVLGTPQALAEHAELMKRFPDMEHADPYMAHVRPGARGEIVWQFTEPGEFEFACLQPGHFEAGMRGRVQVRPR